LLKYFNMPRKSPLDSACSRVDEVHRSWHLALSEYDNLEGFKSNVNNAIQSLRNITFNIQSQKKELLGFDDWYVEWQERMKNNLILRELQLARNMIVKEKDLEFKSKAIAKIEGAGFDKEILKFAFRPCSDTKKIIYGIYYNYIIYLPIPEEIKSRFIFTCEREWIYDKLPDFELLDAISRAYSFFVKMLKDAGKQFNVSVNFPDSSSYCSNNGLDCMRITKEQRTMSINLLDGINIGLKTIEFVPPEKYIKAAEKRYSALFKSKKITNITKNIFPEQHPFNLVQIFTKQALASLVKDKNLYPMAFILYKDEGKRPIQISSLYRNQGEKLVTYKKIAEEVIKFSGDFVLIIVETFIYSDDKFLYEAQKTKPKGESIVIFLVSKDEIFSTFIRFKRNLFGNIIFYKPEITREKTTENHKQNLLIPIIEALRNNK